MLTPLLMTLILILPYLAMRAMPSHMRHGPDSLRNAAAVGVGLLFLLTASGHFTQTTSMVQMLPGWVPGRELLVYATGLLEIAIATALFWRPTRWFGAWAAAAVLVAFFPANVYAALQYAPMGGHAWGPVYLLVRAPLQLFILWWIWTMVLRGSGRSLRALLRG